MKRENRQETGGAKSFSGKGIFPHQYAFTLLIPLRNLFLSPSRLVKRLALEPHHRVLEVGAGPGYFSPRVAKAVPEGWLTLADIQPEMLEYARKRLQKRGIENVDFYRCSGDEFTLPDGSFDRIFLVTVLGEVENRALYMREFFRMLRPGGVLSISEMAGDPDQLTVEELQTLATTAGFEQDSIHGSKKNYTVNFRRP